MDHDQGPGPGIQWISPGRTSVANGPPLAAYLLKQRSGGTSLVKRWHQRWFTLTGSVLTWQHYANSHLKKRRVGRKPRKRPSVDLASPAVHVVIEPKLFQAPTPYTFQVVQQDFVLNLCARDDATFFRWIEAITAVIHARDAALDAHESSLLRGPAFPVASAGSAVPAALPGRGADPVLGSSAASTASAESAHGPGPSAATGAGNGAAARHVRHSSAPDATPFHAAGGADCAAVPPTIEERGAAAEDLRAASPSSAGAAAVAGAAAAAVAVTPRPESAGPRPRRPHRPGDSDARHRGGRRAAAAAAAGGDGGHHERAGALAGYSSSSSSSSYSSDGGRGRPTGGVAHRSPRPLRAAASPPGSAFLVPSPGAAGGGRGGSADGRAASGDPAMEAALLAARDAAARAARVRARARGGREDGGPHFVLVPYPLPSAGGGGDRGAGAGDTGAGAGGQGAAVSAGAGAVAAEPQAVLLAETPRGAALVVVAANALACGAAALGTGQLVLLLVLGNAALAFALRAQLTLFLLGGRGGGGERTGTAAGGIGSADAPEGKRPAAVVRVGGGGRKKAKGSAGRAGKAAKAAAVAGTDSGAGQTPGAGADTGRSRSSVARTSAAIHAAGEAGTALALDATASPTPVRGAMASARAGSSAGQGAAARLARASPRPAPAGTPASAPAPESTRSQSGAGDAIDPATELAAAAVEAARRATKPGGRRSAPISVGARSARLSVGEGSGGSGRGAGVGGGGSGDGDGVGAGVDAVATARGAEAGTAGMGMAVRAGAEEEEEEEEEETDEDDEEDKIPFGRTVPLERDEEEDGGAAAPGAPPRRHFCVAPDATSFLVRRGPNYRRNKQKAASAAALYEFRGMDVFHSAGKIDHIARLIRLPWPAAAPGKPTEAQLARDRGVPRTFVVNWQLPDYNPALLFGAKQEDGLGWNVAAYFTLTDEALEMVHTVPEADWPPALALWRKFVREPVGSRLHDRFKVVLRGQKLEEVSGARILEPYNGKPMLTRPQHKMWSGPGYFEVDVDVHVFNYVARKVFSSLRYSITDVLCCDAAYVIEAHDDDEMPECCLGAHGFRRIDWGRALEIQVEA